MEKSSPFPTSRSSVRFCTTHLPTKSSSPRSIGISYTDDPDQAIAVIQDMLATVSEVTKEPSPQVGIENFADSAIEIGYRYWVPTQQYFQIRYEVNRAVYNGLMTAGINIPYPKLDVTVENQSSGG